VVVIGLCLYILLNATASFKYEVKPDRIDMTWKILRVVTLRSRSLPLRDVVSARPFRWVADWSGAALFGALLRRGTVILELNRRRPTTLFFTKMLVTPRDPAAFIQRVISEKEKAQSP
jgi:hypothetical protein